MDPLSTIDLLTAMFPSPGELDIPPSTLQSIEKLRAWSEDSKTTPLSGIPTSLLLAVRLPIAEDKSIQVNLSIPVSLDQQGEEEELPVSYSLRQPDWMSKAEVSRLSTAMPVDDVFAAFEYLQETALDFMNTQSETIATVDTTTATTVTPTLVRVWFYFPSLSTRGKRDDLVKYAPLYNLSGFVLAGKPGILCLEGDPGDIDEYMAFIKTHSWGDIPSHQKKVSERFREVEGVQRRFSCMEEITDSLGERSGQRVNRGDMQALQVWLKARGLQEAFNKVLL
ncbi:hypothetical protein ASPZODRAFT_135296 [Penicilliopsis zonata CBS 506.65]|uniref:Small nuclear ribonucleoprotein Prp3 C-terminal domain-containing protein n=1 Tax=Penicilliopsis zonata CBS 506.65 TaxID=1073090 RepID=A0A1L9SBD3_9EURO|nr:hypothetical protein ASPZODRAFT_135296 [Penicilliopsis zonata CBS 506.65]OJJ44474.1 hypothetical protein ASPZODRAFT_135296 [Penicilliopsis zonata CBS 506.65]